MQYLKQSVAVKVVLGQFVDATDGVTPETGVTLGAADQAELLKHDAGATTDIAANTFAAITGAGGMYNLTLTGTDTDTLGMLTVVVADASVCRPVTHEFMVIPANVYDSLFGVDKLEVDAVQVAGSTSSATNLQKSLQGVISGTVQPSSTLTTVKTDLSAAVNDFFNDRIILFTSGVLQGQAATINDYSGSSKDVTVSALTAAPSNGDTFVIL